jgi:Transposase, Mutator family
VPRYLRPNYLRDSKTAAKDTQPRAVLLFATAPAIGVRADGQKLLLAVKAMGGESTEAWRAVLDDLIQRWPATA